MARKGGVQEVFWRVKLLEFLVFKAKLGSLPFDAFYQASL
jgi:hypothetical protein